MKEMRFPRLPGRTTLYCLIGIIFLNLATYLYGCMFIHDQSESRNIKQGFLNVFPEHHFHTENRKHESVYKVKDVLTNSVPPTVHYFWCRKKNAFEFQHYLSVLSAYKILKPTEIVFHYMNYPESDVLGYYQYFDDLLRDLPNFFPEAMQDVRACEPDVDVAASVVERMLRHDGGIFLGTNVVLSPEVQRIMGTSAVKVPVGGSLLAEAGMMFLPERADISLNASQRCVTPSLFSLQRHYCVYIAGEMFPFEIFDLLTDFGSLARLTAYGKSTPLVPEVQNTLIPNIVHYVWLGNNIFSYFNYLSILSSLYVQNAGKVFIHGDYEPTGLLWDEVKIISRVKYIYRQFPNMIYGKLIRHPAHASDVMRFDILHRYGGIYVDWDLIWVNPLSHIHRQYDAVAAVDWPLVGKFPDTFNMGIVLGQKGSKFFKFMTESFRHYIDSNFEYNGIYMPYKVYELHPETLHVDKRLQVICYKRKCHPTWLPGYRISLESSEVTAPFDWKTDVKCVHWTRPDPFEFSDQATLRSSTGIFAEIGIHVLNKAGII